MTIHYHGTPISPVVKLYELAGRCFCVPYTDNRDVARVHGIGQSVMLDNGAYSAWKRNITIDWDDYYRWCEPWLDCPTTWAVVPDVIDGTIEQQNQLVDAWPHTIERAAPVWHMNEPIGRLQRLISTWPKVCIGSTAMYAVVMSDSWQRRMDEVWNVIYGMMPNLHMLRGMQVAGERWPFASLDSTDIARNHNRLHNAPVAMAQRWDAVQCPIKWTPRPLQVEMDHAVRVRDEVEGNLSEDQDVRLL